MVIAIVDAYFSAETQQKALSILLREAPEVRVMPGNRMFRPFTDPTRTGHVGVLHEWDDREAFQAYLGSAVFARSGKELRPLMVRDPESRRFAAEPLATRPAAE
jgi:quinol monooxygenase YgiN